MHWNKPASKHNNIIFYFQNTPFCFEPCQKKEQKKEKRCWPLLNARRLSSGMIKGILGWESCNLWQSVMIWLWLLSGGAKGNHLLQHVSEIKGPTDGFLTEREKCADSSGLGWRCDGDAGVRIIKRIGCNKTVAVHVGMAACIRAEGRLVCVSVCVVPPRLLLHAVLLQSQVQQAWRLPHI